MNINSLFLKLHAVNNKIDSLDLEYALSGKVKRNTC